MSPPVRRCASSLALVGMLLAALSGSGGADPATVSRLQWVFDGPVRATARLGDTLYVGGAFSAVAPSVNALPSVYLLSEATGAVAAPVFPMFDGDVLAVEPDGAGGYFVGGSFLHVGPAAQAHLAHVRADGSFDAAFRPVLDGAVNLMARLGDTLYLHGSFTRVGGTPSSGWGAVSAATAAAVAWRPDMSWPLSPRAMLAADDRLVVGGTDGLPMATSAIVAAFDPASGGRLWYTSVAGGAVRGPRGTVSALLRDGARIVAAHSGGRGLSRLSQATGILDLAWRPEVDTAHAIALAGRTLYVAGSFTTFAGQPRAGLAAIDVDTAALLPWNPSLTAPAARLAAAGGGGVFVADVRIPLGLRRPLLTHIDSAGTVTPWVADARPDQVYLLMPGPSGTVLVSSSVTAFGSVARSGLAAFDLASGMLLPWAPAADGPVTVMGASAGRLTVGGGFTAIDGTAAAGAAALDAATGARLPWTPTAPGTASFVDDAWFYWSAGAGPGGPFALERYALATGGHDPSWRGPVSASLPAGVAFDPRALYVASPAGLTALDRTTARVRWHTPIAARMVAMSGDTLFTDAPGFAVSTVDARTGAVLSSRGLVAPTGLAVADGRLIVAGADPNSLAVGGLYGVTFDTRATPWHPALTQTLVGGLYSLTLDPATVALHVSEGLLVAGGTIGTRTPHALQGLAVFPLEGARAPSGLRARPNGPATEFTWDPPFSPPAGGYVLEAGLSSGQTLAALPLGHITRVAAIVPAGAFYVRVRTAGAVGGIEERSNEILVRGGCPAAPPPPTGFRAVLSGAGRDRATFAWDAPDAFVASYTLVVGSAPGLADIGTLPFDGATTGFTYASAIPPGTYHLRLQAANACGESAYTSSLRVTVGSGTDLPGAPADLRVEPSGAVPMRLAWTAPPGAVTGYVLEAGTDAGLADLASVLLGPVPGFDVPAVPPGVYVLRVRAENAAGVGPPSGEIVLRVP